MGSNLPRILHFGVGNFHRAHQAWYTQTANALHPDAPQWRITGVSLRSAAIRDALVPQRYAYTLAILNDQSVSYNQITVHDAILVAPENSAQIVGNVADPEVQVITLTVTEKGYHLVPATGRLDLYDTAIQHDLTSSAPRTVIGFLTYGLAARAHGTAGPITIISCDNLPENGHLLRQAVLDFATAAGLELDTYIARSVRFPATMVDRITPATTNQMRADVARSTGRAEAHPVTTEGFSDWVLEDNFAGPTPDWASAGAVITQDVVPFEARKLRLLNAAHSYLAYAGVLSGYSFVHQAVADPKLRANVIALFEEAARTLPAQARATADDYGHALLARFANPHLKHELRQIAMDGSQKIPVRILGTLRDRHAVGLSAPMASAALAAWIAFLRAEVTAERPLQDGAAQDLQTMVQTSRSVATLCQATLLRLDFTPPNTAWFQQLCGTVSDWSAR